MKLFKLAPKQAQNFVIEGKIAIVPEVVSDQIESLKFIDASGHLVMQINKNYYGSSLDVSFPLVETVERIQAKIEISIFDPSTSSDVVKTMFEGVFDTVEEAQRARDKIDAEWGSFGEVKLTHSPTPGERVVDSSLMFGASNALELADFLAKVSK